MKRMKYHLLFINTKMNTGNVSGDTFLAVNSRVHTWSSGHISSFNPLFPVRQHIYSSISQAHSLKTYSLPVCEISCHEYIRFYVISLRILITCSFIHFVYIHRGTRYGVHGSGNNLREMEPWMALPTVRVPRLWLRLTGLMAGPFIHWAILLANHCFIDAS